MLYKELINTGLIHPDKSEPSLSFSQYVDAINSHLTRDDLYKFVIPTILMYYDISKNITIESLEQLCTEDNDSDIVKVNKNRKLIEYAFNNLVPTPIKSGYSSLVIMGEDNDAVIRRIDEVLQIADRTLPNYNHEEKPFLLILSRTVRQQEEFKNYLKDYQIKYPSRVKILTYHSCKGLQARYTILLGDCFYFSKAPFKDMIYSLTDFGQKYDLVQKDEAFRLAYVAVTRAEEEAYWFVKQRDGGAAKIVSAFQSRVSL
jgi:hypothetical protein